MDRHKPVPAGDLTATRAMIAKWAATLPAPDASDVAGLKARLQWQLVRNQLPGWTAADYEGTPPVGLAPLLARHAGIARAFAQRILSGERAFSIDADWVQKLFS